MRRYRMVVTNPCMTLEIRHMVRARAACPLCTGEANTSRGAQHCTEHRPWANALSEDARRQAVYLGGRGSAKPETLATAVRAVAIGA
jgi:hypothetical protein